MTGKRRPESNRQGPGPKDRSYSGKGVPHARGRGEILLLGRCQFTHRFEPDVCSLDKPGQQVKWSYEGHNFYGLAAALVFSLLRRESDLHN